MDNASAAALRLLDKLLAERPEGVGHDFSEATRWIAAYRDELVSEWRRTRAETDRQRLARVNAVLSVVVGGHYKLAQIPWKQIELARDQFKTVVTTTAGEPV